MMDNEKQLSAPQVDTLIYRAEKLYEIIDAKTKGLVTELFQKLQSIAVCGDDELRELWLTAPRGSIEDFGDYENYLEDGEEESRKEFGELWLSEYPEPQKWYKLSAPVYRGIYSVFINNKLVLQISFPTTIPEDDKLDKAIREAEAECTSDNQLMDAREALSNLKKKHFVK